MKIISLILITIFLTTCVFAQQITKTDDALLLDCYQNQRYADAADYLKKTYPEPVTDLNVLAKLAYSTQMAGKLADAEGYYRRIYNIDSTKNAVLFNLGSINLRRGNNSKAAIYYKKIIEKDTINFIVYKQLAKISFEKGEQAEMMKYLLKANKLNPAEPDVAADLSDMLILFKKQGEAEIVLNKAIAEDPENIDLLIGLLKLYASEDKSLDVKNTCLKIIDAGSGSPFVLTKLGMAYYNLKEYECAVATLLALSPTEQNETSCYIIGLAFKKLKDQPKAIEYFKKAIDIGISPNIADYYGEIADSDEKMVRFKKAAEAYQKALQFGEDPVLYYLLASLYDTGLKNTANARRFYKKYLQSSPPEKQKTYIDYSKKRLLELK